MSIQETAAVCLALLDKHEASRPSHGLSPRDRARLFRDGSMGLRPPPPVEAGATSLARRKPTAPGRLPYGGIAAYARELVRTGYQRSLADLAAPHGISPQALATALAKARRELGVMPQARPLPGAMRAAVEECRAAVVYRHGLFSAIAARHGVDRKRLLSQLNHLGITRRSLARRAAESLPQAA